MVVVTDRMRLWGAAVVMVAGLAVGAGGCASGASTSGPGIGGTCINCADGAGTPGRTTGTAASGGSIPSPSGQAASPSSGCVDVCPPSNPAAHTGHVTLPLASPRTAPQLGTVTAVHESDSGKTVHVPVGGVVNLVDFSSFWSVPQASDPSVLATSTTQDAWRQTCGTGLHAQLGCTIPSTPYRAVKAGTVQLTASRTQCGEAMPCKPPNSYSFAVTVVVG
jgi:hypothetical protein